MLFCAQGYCCNAPCAGACQSCALPNTLGTCTNVPINQVDPSAQCVDKLAPSCNTNGKCDGNGGCQLYVQGTTCLGSTCPAGASTFTGTSTCDGAGKCLTPNATPCFPYACGASVCKNSCTTTSSDCASPAVCSSNGSCGLKPPGQACVTGVECTSGFCSQSVCCATACTGRLSVLRAHHRARHLQQRPERNGRSAGDLPRSGQHHLRDRRLL